MTQFRALPVRQGDAYLLTSSRGNYLVDGGAAHCGLPDMLTDRKVKRLRAVICTSTRPEKLGGIVDLIRSGRRVNEIWLPGTIETAAEAARRFDGDWEGWLKLSSGKTANQRFAAHKQDHRNTPTDARSRRLAGAAALLQLALALCLGEAPQLTTTSLPQNTRSLIENITSIMALRIIESGAPSPSVTQMGWQLLRTRKEEDLIHLCGELLQSEANRLPGSRHQGTRPLVQGLALAAQITGLLARSEAKIRFFKHTEIVQRRVIPRHPIKCINGYEFSPLASNIDPTAHGLLDLAKRIASPNKSLVFQYGDQQCGVLFCSDTRLHFLKNNRQLHLDRPTVITAPRQGNPSAERAYAHIKSDTPKRDVWVRTHYSNATTISDKYKHTPNKLCLTNCVYQTTQEILLEFTNKSWTRLSGNQCPCGQ